MFCYLPARSQNLLGKQTAFCHPYWLAPPANSLKLSDRCIIPSLHFCYLVDESLSQAVSVCQSFLSDNIHQFCLWQVPGCRQSVGLSAKSKIISAKSPCFIEFRLFRKDTKKKLFSIVFLHYNAKSANVCRHRYPSGSRSYIPGKGVFSMKHGNFKQTFVASVLRVIVFCADRVLIPAIHVIAALLLAARPKLQEGVSHG